MQAQIKILSIALSFSVLSACGLTKQDGAGLVSSGSNLRTTNLSLAQPSGLSRGAGVEIIAKLAELFPNASFQNDCGGNHYQFSISDPEYRKSLEYYASPELINFEAQNGGRGIPRAGIYDDGACHNGLAKYIPSLQAIGIADRSSSPLTQMSSRIFFDELCAGNNLSTNATQLFTEGSDILLSGEQFPTDPALRIAFTVARRAWRFPYPADSAEVATLADLYRKSGSADQKKNLCQAAIYSQQFWIGNPLQEDVLRRISLPIAGRSPTFQEIENYKKKTLTLRQFTKKLQAEPAYLKNVLRWHGEQLGLRNIITTSLTSASPRTTLNPNFNSASRLAGVHFNMSSALDGVPVFNVANYETWRGEGCIATSPSWANPRFSDIWPTYQEALAGESPPNLSAPFDPRTTGIVWEQYNPQVNRFEILAAWVLKPFLNQYQAALGADPVALNLCHPYATDPRWLKCNGLITQSNGSKKQITLEDVTIETANSNQTYGTISSTTTDENGSTRTNNLMGTPLEHLKYNIFQYGNRPLRRMVRYSPPTSANSTGRNTDFSQVTGLGSNTKIYACNSLGRFLATCSYHPPLARVDLAIHQGFKSYYDNQGHTAENTWNAAKSMPYLDDDWVHNGISSPDSFSHPDIINSFHCGPINQSALAADSLNVDQALPYGYEPLPAYVSGPSPESQVPASWTASGQGSYSQASLNASTGMFKGGFSFGNGSQSDVFYGPGENQYVNKVITGLQNEPYNLITDIISNNKSYGLLTTANYTLVSKALELLYRSGGEALPFLPANYASVGGSTTMDTVVNLNFDSIGSVPRRAYNIDGPGGSKSVKRPAAGILAMPAVLEPMSDGSPRSVSARVFKRFLCGDANIYNPEVEQKTTLHMDSFKRMASTVYDPAHTATVQLFVQTHLSTNGVLRKDCMSCHQNLDPLGMSLFKNYGSFLAEKRSLAYVTLLSELRKSSNGGGPSGVVSDPEQIGTGVFLGKTVSGFAGVGQAISESRLFYDCSAQTAFNHMYGRMPADAEAIKPFKAAVDKFYRGRNYNELILDLADMQELLGGQ